MCSDVAFSLVSYHIKTCQSNTSEMLDLAIFYPNRYPIKVEDFFTTIAFLKNATNLPEYPLLIVVRTGFEPVQPISICYSLLVNNTHWTYILASTIPPPDWRFLIVPWNLNQLVDRPGTEPGTPACKASVLAIYTISPLFISI